MAVFNGMFPVLPGKDDAARKFAEQTVGPLLKEFTDQQANADITRETWTIQQTPAGTFILVWFEGNVEEAFANIGSDQGEFATWFRAQVIDVTGVDLAAPDDGPLPEVLLDWRR